MANNFCDPIKLKFDIEPCYTRRCFDVDSTLFECDGRQTDVETTLCALLAGSPS